MRENSRKIQEFGNQAAGHGGLLKDGKTIWKNFCDQEWTCYEAFKSAPGIQPFIPEYFGRKWKQDEKTRVTQCIHFLSEIQINLGLYP